MHCLGEVVDPAHQTRGTQIRIHWSRVHQHPRVQHVVRVEGSLDLPEDLECGRRVHRRQQLRAGAAIPVLTRQRASVAGDQLRCLCDKGLVSGCAALLSQRKVDPYVHAPVAEVSIRQSVQSMIIEQSVEIAQIGTKVLDRHRGVLPAGICGPSQADARQSGTVLPDLPQCCCLRKIAHHQSVRCCGPGQQRIRAGPQLSRVIARELDEYPAVTAWQRRYGCITFGAAYDIDDPAVQALTRGGVVIEEQWRGVCRIGHRWISKRDHDLVRRIGHQSQRRTNDHCESALAASQEARHVEVVLRQ